jgi:hypothetical protein
MLFALRFQCAKLFFCSDQWASSPGSMVGMIGGYCVCCFGGFEFPSFAIREVQ